MRIDPVVLEILSNKVTSIAEEAGFTIQRTGRTLYVKETADFGTALVNFDGKFFAYPDAIGVSGFIDLDCGPTIRAVGALEPGDVIITNHPYISEGLASHLPDLQLVAPYYHDGKLVCYGWSFLHSSDVGGRVPGSISPSNSEVFQEGLLIPPVKLCVKGTLNPYVLAMLRGNSRTPDENLGDLKAMLAAHLVAERRVNEVIEQHGLETFMQCQRDLIEYAAIKSREVLRKIPDGVYDFWDFLDDDLATPIPLRVRVRMGVRDGLVELDFAGTDPQTLAAFNVPTAGKRHAWLTLRLMAFICTHDRTVPLNSGVFENISVRVPSGTVLNPEFPAAVGVRHATAIRVADVVNGALLKAVPQAMPACTGGVVIPIVLAESATKNGRRNVLVVQPMVGGMGARYGQDGVDGRDSSISNLSNNPLETVESGAAVAIRSYALRAGSGGAGRWRGGVGLRLTFELLCESASVLGRGMDRFRFQPWGVAGGRPGANAETVLNIDRPDARRLGRIDMITLKKGDTFTVLTPGAGGYGDPLERDPEAVLRDVRKEVVSRDAALHEYGVVIDGARIDGPATQRERGRRSGSVRQDFDFGVERTAWDEICDDETMNILSRKLDGIRVEDRAAVRRRIFQEVLPELWTIGGGSLAASVTDRKERRAKLQAIVAAIGDTGQVAAD